MGDIEMFVAVEKQILKNAYVCIYTKQNTIKFYNKASDSKIPK